MAAPTLIGSKDKRDNGQALSGDAYHNDSATANFADNYLDFGFMPEQIYVENNSGSNLEIKFLHQVTNANGEFVAPDSPANSVRLSALLESGASRVFRKRNHRYIALKGNGNYFVEAW